MMEGVVTKTARVFSEISGVKAAYALNLTDEPGVLEIPQDITDVPVVTVHYLRFELSPGTPEVIQHFVEANIWARGRSAAEAEPTYLPIVTGAVVQFRSRVFLFGAGQPHAKINRGGPPVAEEVNGQPFVRFPIEVQTAEVTAVQYTGGPTS